MCLQFHLQKMEKEAQFWENKDKLMKTKPHPLDYDMFEFCDCL